MDRSKDYSLLLLAGGKSSRMGRNKAELLYEGRTFVDSLLSKAKELGITQIYLSGYQNEKEQVQVVWDIYPQRGPLGGVHACMKAVNTPFCLVLPVDVPQIPIWILEELITYHEKNRFPINGKDLPMIIQHRERKEYLIGIYPVTMMDFIEGKIKDQPVSVHRLLEEWGYVCHLVDVPHWQLYNINTQEAYEELLLNKK